MSLTTSLYTGLSGLSAESTDLSVIGDNIANANTIGFKQSRTSFADALSQELIGAGQVGLGANVQTVQKLVAQGSLSNTGNATDLALSGNGFFMVKGTHDGQDGTFYTRAGQFTVDKAGDLVNLEGLKVQGFPADPAGVVGGVPGDLQVGTAISQPSATTTLTTKGNLKADAVIPPAWNATDPTNTSNFPTSVVIYDSLGQAHQVDTYYRRTGAGTWEFHSLTDGGGLAGGTAGTATEIASGTLTFDTDGKLSAVTQTSSFTPLNATTPQPLTLNLGDPTSTGGTGLAGLTQTASPSASTFISQDGFAAGTLSNVTVDTSGNVTGAFSNGQTRVLGQVAVASFQAQDQLRRSGGNLFEATQGAGQPAVGTASSGGRGAIIAGALEQSNVDLATQFVQMISAQRGFEANSKTITTADSLLSELIQLKR
jgi:flagellar hook protein FlgE